MCTLLWKIMTWCHQYQITLKARHIPQSLNMLADLLSRSNQVQSTKWLKKMVYAYPPTALLRSKKSDKSSCVIIVIAPGWPGMPWFWDLVQLSTGITLQLPVSRILKQSHNYVFHSNPQHFNLHAWCLGVDSAKNKASLWGWQRELQRLSTRIIYNSKFALFEK